MPKDSIDPVEERDVEKLLAMLDDPRVQEKLAKSFIVLQDSKEHHGIIVRKVNVSLNREGI